MSRGVGCTVGMRLILLLLLEVAGASPAPTTRQWGLLLDCGSSGTRLHIYSWNSDGAALSEFIPSDPGDAALLKLTPGISSFATTPEGVGPYLEKLLTQAERWVPAASVSQTRVRAYATAGMRLLSAAEQQPIWSAASITLGSSAFLFHAGDATTVSGNYEGLWNWMGIRFILQQSGTPPPELLGGLDLGGASTQISFVPRSGIVTQDAYTVVHNATVATVYSHSYMKLGQDQAVLRLAQKLADAGPATGPLANPCFNEGLTRNLTVSCAAGPCNRTFVGRGPADYDKCRALAAALPKGECLLEPCAIDGTYQPSPEDVRFYAVSAFWYTVHGIGLCDDACSVGWGAIETAGKAFCSKPWSEVGTAHGLDFCFGSAYVPSLLEAYAFERDATSITYADEIGGFAVSWALGAQIFAIDEMRCEIATAAQVGTAAPFAAQPSARAASPLPWPAPTRLPIASSPAAEGWDGLRGGSILGAALLAGTMLGAAGMRCATASERAALTKGAVKLPEVEGESE
jgi:apyrase